MRTTEREYEFDIIVYATGFDAITGAYDRIDIRGVGGADAATSGATPRPPSSACWSHGFPNLLMPTGPQSGSASTNFPRGIEIGVNWCTDLLEYMWRARLHRATRPRPRREERWTAHVTKMYNIMLMRKAKGWFTGYNSNVDGHEKGTIRYFVYNGGTPKYRKKLVDVAEHDYEGFTFR